mgnify:CR=1 FL=1
MTDENRDPIRRRRLIGNEPQRITDWVRANTTYLQSRPDKQALCSRISDELGMTPPPAVSSVNRILKSEGVDYRKVYTKKKAGKKTKKVVDEPKHGKVHPVRLSRLERQVTDLQDLLLKLCIELGVDPEEDNNG